MQKRGFLWLLTVLCAVSLAVFTYCQRQDVVSEEDLLERTGTLVVEQQQHQSHEAVLSEDTLPYRVSCSRSQRILPTHGARGERLLTSAIHCVRQQTVKPLRSFYDSRCRQESAPFSLSSSCDYYVIALRHIIR